MVVEGGREERRRKGGRGREWEGERGGGKERGEGRE